MPEPDIAGSVADHAHAGAGQDRADQSAAEALRIRALTWNIEWLGDPREGPFDDARQLELAAETLKSFGPQLAGLQEIAAPSKLEPLVASWPSHAVVISSYAQRQQVALVYDTTRFELERSRVLEGYDGLADAGRPPLEVELSTPSGERLFVIVVHAKAGDDLASWRTRERLGRALHAYLMQERADEAVLALGDFNDLFSLSTVEGQPSPYAALVADGTCTAVTARLEAGPEVSTVWGANVDHVLLCGALTPTTAAPLEIEGLREEVLARHPDFFDAVSDHAPVSVELTF